MNKSDEFNKIRSDELPRERYVARGVGYHDSSLDVIAANKKFIEECKRNERAEYEARQQQNHPLKGTNISPGAVGVSCGLIGTTGLGPCNGLIIYDGIEKTAAVAHVVPTEKDLTALVEHMVSRVGTPNDYESIIVLSVLNSDDLAKRLKIALRTNPRIINVSKHYMMNGFDFYFDPRNGRIIDC